MKQKYVALLAVLLLTGCQDEENRFITYTMPPTIEEQVEEVEQVRPSVIVYGMESVTNGFVVHVEEREKWLVTIASAVSHHPQALIETAEGQLVRATVEAIDPSHNIAIIKFRNSAEMTPFTLTATAAGEIGKVGVATLTEDLQLTSLTSVDEQGNPILVEPAAIQHLLEQAREKPMQWQERAELAQTLQMYAPLGTNRVNKIDTYDNDVFLYNPDELMLTVQQMHDQLRLYFKTKDLEAVADFIYSDDLLRKLEKVERTEELQPLKIQSVMLKDTMYEVTGELIDGKNEKKYSLTYQLIKHNERWYVIALKFT